MIKNILSAFCIFGSVCSFAQPVYSSLLKDIFTAHRSSLTEDASDYFEIGKTNGKLVFRAASDYVNPTTDTTNKNYELFVSDGTEAGTMLLKDIYPSGSSFPNSFFTFRDKVYFSANTGGQDGEGMWVTDGTNAGTTLVKNVRFRAFYNNLQHPNAIEIDPQHFIFAADSTYINTNLYISDGTPEGTYTIKDFNPTGIVSMTSHAAPGHFTPVANGKVVFSASTDALGREIYVTDGTAAGTFLLKDINPGTGDFLKFSDGFTHFHSDGQRAYFFANDGVNGAELWVSDGTVDGTVLLKDINPGTAGSLRSLTGLATINGITFFMAKTDANGSELYKTDGTANGTSLVTDFRPGSFSGIGNYIAALNGKLIFTGSPDGLEFYMYALDPASSTPEKIQFLYRYSAASQEIPYGPNFIQSNIFCDKLFYNGYNATGVLPSFVLGVTDGTAEGSGLILEEFPNPNYTSLAVSFWGSSFIELNEELFYRGRDAQSGWELYKIPVCAPFNAVITEVEEPTNTSTDDVRVFPNPSQNRFTVEIPAGQKSGGLTLTDLSGKVILTEKMTENRKLIEHQLPAGIYILSFRNTELTAVQKLVISR